MEGTLRSGVAGLGNAGPRCLTCLDKIGRIRLGAVADARGQALQACKEKYPNVPPFADVGSPLGM